ncbi:MAG: SGNH/GDSL hydrolase family protein [Nanoarchaeota archaeon]|nr:SGNH/GDSL hydrolase family protein [Nanoarchaeota archaeon]MBU1030485.1 SGNH/GDSL hydrolase family protein [Nanoarchaeota archaeon]
MKKQKNKTKKLLKKNTKKISLLIITIIIIEILLHLIWPKNIDLGIQKGDLIFFTPEKTKIHKWVGGELGYELIPYASYKNYTINTLGFRDYEYNKIKKNNTFRIIIVGDSVTFGWNINLNDTFSKQIENHLKYKNKTYEVWNAGIGGYYANQEIALFKKKILFYKPDLVIFAFVLNDFRAGAWYVFDEKAERYIIQQTKFRKPSIIKSEQINKLLFKSKFFEIINLLLFKITKNEEIFQDYYQDEQNNLVEQFSEVKNLADENQIELRTIIIPLIRNYQNYNLKELHIKAKNIMNESGIRYFDMLSHFKKYDYKSFKIEEEDEYHYNALGNKIIANLTIYYLKQEGLI